MLYLKKIGLVVLMGLLLAMPSLLVVEYVYSGLEIPLPEMGMALLCLVVFAGSFILAAWLGRRLNARVADVFLAGAVCWEMLGIFFRRAFEAPGFLALLFAAAAVVWYRFPLLSRHRTARRVGRVIFWIGFICTYLLYGPVFEGKR